MTAGNVLVLFALAFLLASNVYLFLRYKAVVDLAEDAYQHLERVRKERDDMEKTIAAIHEIYQKELRKQRDMFCWYWAEKKKDDEV